MRVEIGNTNPHQMVGGARRALAHGEPCVTMLRLPDDMTLEPGASASEMLTHLALNPIITHLPDHEMLVAIFHTQQGAWYQHGSSTPEWVHVESELGTDEDIAKAAELERLLVDAWGCAHGRPADVEARYHTASGPPGVGSDTPDEVPEWLDDMQDGWPPGTPPVNKVGTPPGTPGEPWSAP